MLESTSLQLSTTDPQPITWTQYNTPHAFRDNGKQRSRLIVSPRAGHRGIVCIVAANQGMLVLDDDGTIIF